MSIGKERGVEKEGKDGGEGVWSINKTVTSSFTPSLLLPYSRDASSLLLTQYMMGLTSKESRNREERGQRYSHLSSFSPLDTRNGEEEESLVTTSPLS